MSGPRTRSKTNVATNGQHTSIKGPTGWTHRAVPINQLPNELLVGIILLLRDSEFDPDDSHGPGYEWLQLAGVCRIWRSVMLNTPSLWTIIRVEQNLSLFHLFLERSRKLPVDVNFHSCLGTKCSSPKQTAIICAIVEIAHRVRRLALDRMDGFAFTTFVKHFVPRMPMLEDLYLQPREVKRLLLPLSTLAPHLQILRMYRVSFDPQRCSLPNLTTLVLGNMPSPFAISNLLKILENTPKLQKLELDYAGLDLPQSTDPLPAKASPSVSLPCLTTLVIREASDTLVQVLSHLAPALDFPTTATVELILPRDEDVEIDEDEPLSLPTAFDNAIIAALALFPYIKLVDSLDLVVTGKQFTVAAYHAGHPPLLSFDLHRDAEEDQGYYLSHVMHRLAQPFAGAPIHFVKACTDYAGYTEHDDWFDFLRAFPLERVEVHGLETICSLYYALIPPNKDRLWGKEKNKPHCLDLKELEIHDFAVTAQTLEAMMEMVKEFSPLRKLTLIKNAGENRLSEAEVDQILAAVDEFKCTEDGLPRPLPQRLQHILWRDTH